MKLKAIKGSENEVFCCSMKKAKEIFKNTDVYLNFGYLGKHFVAYPREQHYNYIKKHIKGKVLCEMCIIDRKSEQILSFYFINSSLFNAYLRNEFENKYLPEFFRIYQEKQKDTSLIYQNKIILVELFNERLILHEANI